MQFNLAALRRLRSSSHVYHNGKFQRYYPVQEGYVSEDGTFWPLEAAPPGVIPGSHALESINVRQLNQHKIKLNGEFLANLTGIPKYRWHGLSKVEKAQVREILERVYPELDAVFTRFEERLYHEYQELLEVEIEPDSNREP